MARTSFFLLPLALCIALLLPFCLANDRRSSSQEHRRSRYQGDCNIQKLNSQRPTTRVESEAGLSEIWDENEQQFDCAGVSPIRHTIQPNGLFLPRYSNYPTLVYVVQGEGIGGVVMPGCPETFQSFQQFQLERGQDRRHSSQEESDGERSQRSSRQESERRRHSSIQQGDEHQRVHNIRLGDIIALPVGATAWAYNTGDRPLVMVAIRDISSRANQLDRSPRTFFLAGNNPQERSSSRRQESRRRSSQEDQSNIFNGFDTEILSEAFGVDKETAGKLQNTDDTRGFIIKVNNFQVARPRGGQQQEEQESSRRTRRSHNNENGMEDLMCNMQLVQNIDDPSRASDVYNREAGYLSDVNRNSLPILNYIKIGASRGHLRRNAVIVPHWHMNSHSVVYVIRGSARMQIVNDNGESVHDGRVEEGEFIVVPQNFVVMTKAEENEFDWVSFKTSDNAITISLAGKTSVLRGIPEDVLRNSYGISREEARRLKYGREEETLLVAPRPVIPVMHHFVSK